MRRACELRLSRLGDVILAHLTGAPARDIKEAVIHGEIDVRDKGRDCSKPLKNWWQLLFRRWLRRDRRRFLDVKLAAFSPPGPDRAFKVRRVDNDAQEAVFAHGIVRRAHLEHHLMVGAEIDGLNVAPCSQIPEMDAMTILV